MSQRQVPGGPFLNETAIQQRQLPGGAFANENTSSGAYSFSAATGSFVLTGNAATLTPTASQAPLIADTALPFVWTGFAAGLRKGYKFAAATGTFTLSVAPSLSDHENDSNKGTFTLTGNAAGLACARKLSAAKGTFTFTGNETVLIPPESGNFTISAETGVFALTGNSATLSRVSITMVAESGTFTLTGNPIPGSTRFSVDSGSFTLTGKAATFTLGTRTPWSKRADPTTAWTRRARP